MWCGVITLCPSMYDGITQFGITKRAIDARLLDLDIVNLRDFAKDRHGTVDDRPYGGGPGMVIMPQPLNEAIRSLKQRSPVVPKVVYVSPTGKRFDHKMARSMANEGSPLVFIAGRYEGIDQRVIDSEVDEQISLGDYVLTNGDLAVMVILDAMARWIPGALGHPLSAQNDAFTQENEGLLDCPHYTRPECLAQGNAGNEQSVPSVLLSGDHRAIDRWRKKQQLGQTWLHRADLLEKSDLDENAKQLLGEFQNEYTQTRHEKCDEEFK